MIEKILSSFERHKYVYSIVYFILGLLILCFTEFRNPISSYLNHHTTTITSLGNIATLVGAILALAGLKLIWRELVHNKDQAKKQRTFELIGKHYDPVFVEFTVNASRYLYKTEKPNYDDLKKDNDLRMRCYLLMDYYEDLSHMYNKDLIDRKIIHESLRGAILGMYKKSKDMIQEMRIESKNDRIYKQWEILYDRLIELQQKDSI